MRCELIRSGAPAVPQAGGVHSNVPRSRQLWAAGGWPVAAASAVSRVHVSEAARPRQCNVVGFAAVPLKCESAFHVDTPELGDRPRR